MMQSEWDAHTIICRCESVTYGDVISAADDAATTNVDDMKKVSRYGMGACQNRTCGVFTSSPALGDPQYPNRRMRVRPPLRPVSLACLREFDQLVPAPARSVLEEPDAAQPEGGDTP